MKIYLDDERKAPKDWYLASDFGSFVNHVYNAHIFNEAITHISFDHDLGTNMTGHDCLKWLLDFEEVDLSKTIITFHAANSIWKENMESLWNTYRKIKGF